MLNKKLLRFIQIIPIVLLLLIFTSTGISAANTDTVADQKIDSITLNGYPSKGAVAQTVNISSATTGAAVSEYVWLRSGERMPVSDTFGNDIYSALVTLQADDGYVFTADTTARAFDGTCRFAGISKDGKSITFITPYVNQVCTHNWVMTSDSTAYAENGYSEYRCVKCQSLKKTDKSGKTEITYATDSAVANLINLIEITDVTAPQSGKTPQSSATADGCKITNVSFNTSDKFDCLTSYTVTVELEASGMGWFCSATMASVNGFAAQCGIISPSKASVSFTFEPYGHIFGNFETEQFPTCTEPGTNIRRCTVCNATETEEIPLTEHIFMGHEGVAADCMNAGWQPYFQCENCNGIFDESGNPSAVQKLEIDPSYHVYPQTYKTVNDNSPTDHSLVCICGATVSKEAHVFGQYTENKAERTKSRSCNICGYTETEEIPLDIMKISVIVSAILVIIITFIAIAILLKKKQRS